MCVCAAVLSLQLEFTTFTVGTTIVWAIRMHDMVCITAVAIVDFSSLNFGWNFSSSIPYESQTTSDDGTTFTNERTLANPINSEVFFGVPIHCNKVLSIEQV